MQTLLHESSSIVHSEMSVRENQDETPAECENNYHIS